ncbi:nucleotide-binding domain-containing protein [Propioniciclava flava]
MARSFTRLRGNTRVERSDFKGEHVVECYVVRDGVVVARDRLDVPISNTSIKPAAVS